MPAARAGCCPRPAPPLSEPLPFRLLSGGGPSGRPSTWPGRGCPAGRCCKRGCGRTRAPRSWTLVAGGRWPGRRSRHLPGAGGEEEGLGGAGAAVAKGQKDRELPRRASAGSCYSHRGGGATGHNGGHGRPRWPGGGRGAEDSAAHSCCQKRWYLPFPWGVCLASLFSGCEKKRKDTQGPSAPGGDPHPNIAHHLRASPACGQRGPQTEQGMLPLVVGL